MALNISPWIKAGQGDPVGGVGPQKPVKVSETGPVPAVRSPTRGPSYTTVTSRSVPHRLPSYLFSLCELLWPRLVDSLSFLITSLTPFGSHNPFLPSSSGFSKLGLMSGYGSLHLFPSDENRARHQSSHRTASSSYMSAIARSLS